MSDNTIYTKGQVPQDKFEEWKDECRETFKNERFSGNGIHACLLGLDDKANDEERKKTCDNSLFTFYQNHLARNGQLLCQHCGNKMEVYYSPQCFHCEECKPKIEKYEGNLMQAMRWLVNQEEEFNKDEFWRGICNYDLCHGNDTYMKLTDSDSDDAYGRNLKLFKKHFEIEDTKWFVSW